MGPIDLFVAFAFQTGSSWTIGVDNSWCLDFTKSKLPKLERLYFSKVDSTKGIVSGGVDVALECAAGEFTKGPHTVELVVWIETDTSEILNKIIMPIGKFWGVVSLVSTLA